MFEFTADPALLSDMRRDLDRLDRHGAADRPHYAEFYDSLLKAHRNDEAQAWLAAHPILQRTAPPELHEATVPIGVPSLWVADADKRELTREPYAPDATAQVVVLAGTDCHYSRNAVRDIDADPVLRELFHKHARWVAPAQDIVGFDALQTWNQAHPSQPLAVASDNAQWPMFRVLETPTFFFYRRGKLVDTVVGWPRDGNAVALRRALRKIGLAH